MVKAVLVMDMPEQVCQKCALCYETENDNEYLCCAVGKLLQIQTRKSTVLTVERKRNKPVIK